MRTGQRCRGLQLLPSAPQSPLHAVLRRLQAPPWNQAVRRRDGGQSCSIFNTRPRLRAASSYQAAAPAPPARAVPELSARELSRVLCGREEARVPIPARPLPDCVPDNKLCSPPVPPYPSGKCRHHVPLVRLFYVNTVKPHTFSKWHTSNTSTPQRYCNKVSQ